MFARVRDMFDVVVNFLSSNWEPKHVTIGLFKAIKTNGAATAIKLRALLDKFFLTNVFLHMLKTRAPTYNLVQLTWTQWFLVKVWAC